MKTNVKTLRERIEAAGATPRTYDAWLAIVRARGWTLADIWFDVRPTQAVMDLLDAVGLDRWGQWVMRCEREGGVS